MQFKEGGEEQKGKCWPGVPAYPGDSEEIAASHQPEPAPPIPVLARQTPRSLPLAAPPRLSRQVSKAPILPPPDWAYKQLPTHKLFPPIELVSIRQFWQTVTAQAPDFAIPANLTKQVARRVRRGSLRKGTSHANGTCSHKRVDPPLGAKPCPHDRR